MNTDLGPVTTYIDVLRPAIESAIQRDEREVIFRYRVSEERMRETWNMCAETLRAVGAPTERYGIKPVKMSHGFYAMALVDRSKPKES